MFALNLDNTSLCNTSDEGASVVKSTLLLLFFVYLKILPKDAIATRLKFS